LQPFCNITVAVDSAEKSATSIMSMHCGWTLPSRSCQLSSSYDVCLLLHALFFVAINLSVRYDLNYHGKSGIGFVSFIALLNREEVWYLLV
jgi:hypothetical protein